MLRTIVKSKIAEFICRVASTIDEAKSLIAIEFDYVCGFNGAKMFMKRK